MPFKDQRIGEKYQLVIAKKEIEVDYLGIDVSSLVGGGLRLAKTVNQEQRRNKEVARYVAQNLHQILKRFHINKGLGLFLDGSETLHKAHLNRSASITRRLESRLQRLPATPLMQVIEERIVKMMPENRTFPAEVVFSGTCVPGAVEMKMSAWALDVSGRDLLSSSQEAAPVVSACSDSLCLVGGGELFLNSLALTPFFSITSMLQSNSDFKEMRLQGLLEWLALDSLAKEGDASALSRARTDILFLYTLAAGCGATELSSIPQLALADVLMAYYAVSGIARKAQQENGEQKPELNVKRRFLFKEENGELRVETSMLEAVLSRCWKRGGLVAKACSLTDGYLQHALQSHRMLCLGDMANPYFLPHPTVPQLQNVVGHLMHIVATGSQPFLAANSATGAVRLTAAEFTILSYSQTASVESLAQWIVGAALKPEGARLLTSEPDVEKALSVAQKIFTHANPLKPHKTLCLSPSYCWLQNQKTKLWTFTYVDIGRSALDCDARRRKGSAAGGQMTFSVSSDGPCVFDAPTSAWKAIDQFPYNEVNPASDTSTDSIKLLTWNVMFDRYSGKPTPLGMPGIDWCSVKRYPVLSKVMAQSDADVIGMQEVEPQFWEFLSKEQWVRDNYIISCNGSGPAITPWGVLMMVHRRMRVLQLTHHNVPAWSNHVSLLPVLTIDFLGQPLHVAAVHLLAPFTKGRESARTGQDNALRLRMTKSIAGDCITMGDFNDWPTNEFTMPPESNYVDAWPIVHPKDPGKTMDETNTFCKLKIEEIFFGRSDKFFLRSKRLHPTSAKLVGVRSVNDENGNADAPAYLFPSDHYGVEMTFSRRV